MDPSGQQRSPVSPSQSPSGMANFIASRIFQNITHWIYHCICYFQQKILIRSAENSHCLPFFQQKFPIGQPIFCGKKSHQIPCFYWRPREFPLETDSNLTILICEEKLPKGNVPGPQRILSQVISIPDSVIGFKTASRYMFPWAVHVCCMVQ